MSGMIVLIFLISAPAVLTLVLSSNGAMVFLALCEGLIVNDTLGKDAISALRAVFPRANSVQESTLHLIILLLPAVLTAIFLRRQMKGPRMLFNIAPAVLTGATVALLSVPLLPGGVQYDIQQTGLWSAMEQFEGVIIGTGALISLLLIWTAHSKKHGRRK